MLKKILSFLLAFTVLLSVTGVAFTESKDTQHDRDVEQVLFGPMGVSSNKDSLVLLQWAAYFAMDCIGKENAEEQLFLDKLRDYGVSGVPANVSDFHYKNGKFENQHHERCTHKGWDDSLYGTDTEDIGSWVSVRKPMMIDSFYRILVKGKKEWTESIDLFHWFSPNEDPVVKKQCESLAAIVYYVHILGDHCYNTRMTLSDRIPLVRNHVSSSNPDLLNELKIHLAVLFQSQTTDSQYLSLIADIDDIRDHWMENVGTYDIADDAQYAAYQTEAKKLMNVLKKKVYPLLKNESFFANVFYPSSGN